MFKKEDIKAGMLVEVDWRDEGKSLMYVTEYKNGIVFIDEDSCYSEFKIYNDNLESNYSRIIKVYGFSEYASKSLDISIGNRRLLWDRDNEIDWSKVQKDTKVLVSMDNGYNLWVKRYFAKYENGKIYTYDNGKDSWIGEDYILETWDKGKLWRGEKK